MEIAAATVDPATFDGKECYSTGNSTRYSKKGLAN